MNFPKIKSDLKRVYDDLANYWGQDKTLHDWGESNLIEFANLVGRGAKVLDLGCASGFQSKLLSDRGLEVVGLDLSPRMIAVAKRRVPKAKFVVGDMTKLDSLAKIHPEFVEGFDGVYARASLLHVPKKFIPKVLKSIHKILKREGILYLALKEGEGEKEVTDTRHDQQVTRFFSFFKEKELTEYLKSAGLIPIKVFKTKRNKISTSWLQILARKD